MVYFTAHWHLIIDKCWKIGGIINRTIPKTTSMGTNEMVSMFIHWKEPNKLPEDRNEALFFLISDFYELCSYSRRWNVVLFSYDETTKPVFNLITDRQFETVIKDIRTLPHTFIPWCTQQQKETTCCARIHFNKQLKQSISIRQRSGKMTSWNRW